MPEQKQKTIQEKLNAAMADMKTPAKTAKVAYSGRKFDYAPLDNVMKEVKSALQKHGLTLYQGAEWLIQETDTSPVVIFVLKTSVSDGKETNTLDIRPLDFPADCQKAGAIETYYKRYALNTAFCLTGEADTDGNVEEQPKKKSSKNKKIDQIRELYKKALSAGVEKKVLMEILNQFNKDINDCTTKEVDQILESFTNAFNLASGGGTVLSLA